MIADPNDGRRCSRCWRQDRCPTPEACELAEQERAERSAWVDFGLAVMLLAALLTVILAMTWVRP